MVSLICLATKASSSIPINLKLLNSFVSFLEALKEVSHGWWESERDIS